METTTTTTVGLTQAELRVAYGERRAKLRALLEQPLDGPGSRERCRQISNALDDVRELGDRIDWRGTVLVCAEACGAHLIVNSAHSGRRPGSACPSCDGVLMAQEGGR